MPLKDVLPDLSEAELEAKIAQEERNHERLLASKKPATVGWVARQLEANFQSAASYIFDLREAVKSLEAQVATLEEKSLSYEGVFSKSQQYNPGALVTHRSGLWYCKSATRSAPGTSSDWQLTGKTPLARGGKQ